MSGNLPNVASSTEADNGFKTVSNIIGALSAVVAEQTASRLAYFDSNKKIRSYNTITATQLGYLETISENVQNGLTSAVRITGVQSNIAGAKTFTSALKNLGNVGAVGAATVTATEYGDGVNHVTQLALDGFIVGVLAGAGALALGNIIYSFPAGKIHIEEIYAESAIVLTAAGTAVTTKTGIGSLIGSGPVAVLHATDAKMDDRNAERDIVTGAGGGAPVSAITTTTAGAFMGIALNGVGDVKNVFLNCAGTWNADNILNLTAGGTIIIKWTSLV